MEHSLFSAIQVQTIDLCNLKCPWCPNSYLSQTGKKMSQKLLNKIVNELAGLDYQGRFSPYLMNEPLLDERLCDIVSYARGKLPNANILIATNGTLANAKLFHALFDAGMTRIDVSCYTREVCDKVMAFGMSQVKVRRFYERSGHWNNRGGNIGRPPSEPLRASCPRPFRQMYVDYQGRAVLCCSDYRKEVVMGDAVEDSLVDIWENCKYAKYRELLLQGRRDLLFLCDRCDFQG